MGTMQRKIVLMLAAAVAITGISCYSYWQKNSVAEVAGTQGAADSSFIARKGEAVVYITGAVNKPGVIKVAESGRVADVINAAGGLAPGADVEKVNLAQNIKDGMHIEVPVKNVSVAAGTTPGTGGSPNKLNTQKSADKININTASAQELDKLPGVGPALAARIIEYRQANGNFQSLTDLKKVSGIGDAKFNQLKDKISL